MLKPVQTASAKARSGSHFVIIASKYNARYVDGMLEAARAVLLSAEAARVDVVRVPGAFEIPVVAAKLATKGGRKLAGLICLGVILRGETTHAQHIGEAVSQSLAQIQVQYQLPIIHEVLLLENEAQAQARCLDPAHNRGAEAAATALAMAETMASLDGLLRSAKR